MEDWDGKKQVRIGFTQKGEKKHDMERNWGDTGKTYATEVTLTPDDTYEV